VRRRDFIAGLGAAAWPMAARAQQPKVFRLGYIVPGSLSNPVAVNLRRQFLLGMRDLGYTEERNFKMETRVADGHLDRLPTLAAELAGLPVDILVVGGEASIRAAKKATDKIPIVMTPAADPVGSGLVPSLARPGGNVTGMSALAADLASKRVACWFSAGRRWGHRRHRARRGFDPRVSRDLRDTHGCTATLPHRGRVRIGL
jgi:putative ABC transport system substrate-binding protein